MCQMISGCNEFNWEEVISIFLASPKDSKHAQQN
jgi:hypothetical protein